MRPLFYYLKENSIDVQKNAHGNIYNIHMEK